MESLFLLAFGEQGFLTALAMAGSQAFFQQTANRLVPDELVNQDLAGPSQEREVVRESIQCETR
jgi:hypothetical protein